VARIQDFLTRLDTGEGQVSDELSALLEVRALPIRVACVRLTWGVLLGELLGMRVDAVPTR
jgi:F420-0:gamma-glutamyl ligase-like protein